MKNIKIKRDWKKARKIITNCEPIDKHFFIDEDEMNSKIDEENTPLAKAYLLGQKHGIKETKQKMIEDEIRFLKNCIKWIGEDNMFLKRLEQLKSSLGKGEGK